jgi:hypothetical protein
MLLTPSPDPAHQVTLRELAVNDLVQLGGDAFARLLSTRTNTDAVRADNNNNNNTAASASSDFLKLSYTAYAPEHPEWVCAWVRA